MYHYSTTFTHDATNTKMWVINMTEISPKLGQNFKRNPTLAAIERLANVLGISASGLLK